MVANLAEGDRSTLPLSEVARHVVYPEGIQGSIWDDLAERFDEWSVHFDQWQDTLGYLTLATSGEGKLSCTVGGATWSIPRQVAKTFLGGRLVFGMATTFEDSTWLWTAHRTRTTTQTFQKLAGFAQRKSVKRYLLPDRSDGIRSANGEQEIRFRNGSRLLFGAREQGFGRGFDEVDGEVFDEAQILGERALEDMVPATNQSRMPHGALLLFMGTPPRPVDPGTVFTLRRRLALEGKPEGVVKLERGDALYVECSADPEAGRPGGPSLDDPAQIRLANPSYPHRTPPDAIKRMRRNLPSDDSWRREALGIWDDDSAEAEFPNWGGAKVSPAELTRPVVALDVRMGVQQSVSLGVVGQSENGVLCTVGLYEQRAGAQWSDEQVVGWVAAELEQRGVDRVAVDEYGENGPLIPLLEQKGLTVLKLNTRDMRNACMGFHTAFLNGQVKHIGDAPLDRAVAGARRRKSMEGWMWSRLNSVTDVGPLMAVAGAWWVFTSTEGDYDVMDSFF